MDVDAPLDAEPAAPPYANYVAHTFEFDRRL